MEVSVQHMVHARLLWNHLVAAEEKIKRLEMEKVELKIVNACANQCWHSFENISEVNRQAISEHSLGSPKYIAIYRIHSTGLQHFIAMHC